MNKELNNYENKISELKLLILSIESNNNILTEKNGSLLTELDSTTHTINNYNNLINEQNEIIKEKDRKILQLEDSLRLLDTERDNIQHQLDVEVENRERYTSQSLKLEEDKRELQHAIEYFESQINKLSNNVNNSKQEYVYLESKYNSLKEENNELKRKVP